MQIHEANCVYTHTFFRTRKVYIGVFRNVHFYTLNYGYSGATLGKLISIIPCNIDECRLSLNSLSF